MFLLRVKIKAIEKTLLREQDVHSSVRRVRNRWDGMSGAMKNSGFLTTEILTLASHHEGSMMDIPPDITILSEMNVSPFSNNIRTFAKSEQIAVEGEKSNGWYILLEGKIGVFKHKQQIAEFSKRGVVFGELGFILNTPRTATLIALEDTKAVCFFTSLNQLIADHPEVVKNILVNLAERLAKTTEDYISFVEKDLESL